MLYIIILLICPFQTNEKQIAKTVPKSKYVCLSAKDWQNDADVADELGINYVPLHVIYAHIHMKKKLLLAICLLVTMNGFAQKKDFKYKFYGQIRTDLFYNSRANKETVDGLFYMYPLDKLPDADGKDLNATANGSFYVLYTRLGVDVAGPKLGNAKTSAKVEVDFRGSGTTFSTVRVRHAYLNLD